MGDEETKLQKLSTPAPRQLAPGVHIVDVPGRFAGMQLGMRMTALQLEGGLLLHSPVAVEPALLASLGQPRWAVAPNLFHHLSVGQWVDEGAEAWCAPGLADKRADLEFAGTLSGGSHPFGDEIVCMPLSCFPLTNEVVLLHRPTRTLVVTDLVFNIPGSAPLFTRFAMRCLCGYPGCSATIVERMLMRRAAARRDVATIAEWDFDRLVMSHGEVIESGGKQALLNAFRWL